MQIHGFGIGKIMDGITSQNSLESIAGFKGASLGKSNNVVYNIRNPWKIKGDLIRSSTSFSVAFFYILHAMNQLQ